MGGTGNPVIELPILEKEIAVFEGPAIAKPTCCVLLIPFHFSQGQGDFVAVAIETAPGADNAAGARVLAGAFEEARKAAEAVAKEETAGPAHGSIGSGVPLAIASLDQPDLRRAAMVFIAGEAGARLCGDVALVADDHTLEKLAERILQRRATKTLGNSRDSFAWNLDLMTFDLLSEYLSGGGMPKELQAVLVTYTGEAGRHASSLEEIGENLTDRADFDQRLLTENLMFLEDSSPASARAGLRLAPPPQRGPGGLQPLGPRQGTSRCPGKSNGCGRRRRNSTQRCGFAIRSQHRHRPRPRECQPMSEHAKPPESPQPPELPQPGKSKASAPRGSKPVKAGRAPALNRLRRWAGIVFLSLLSLAILVRIVILIITPSVLRHVAAQYGLTCNYDRLELSLLGGDLGIWRLELTPISGGSPVLQAGYCRAHISTWELLHGRIYAWRLEADGAEINLEREPDGRIPLLERFVATGSTPPQTAAGQSAPVAALPRTSPRPSAAAGD